MMLKLATLDIVLLWVMLYICSELQTQDLPLIMNNFFDALVSESKNKAISEEDNIFGNLIGEWDLEWIDENNGGRKVKGEWLFSWVLDGTAIQDVFIVPSRAERVTNIQDDAEYGTTLRIFNPTNSVWDIFYGCKGAAIQLQAIKEGDKIVITEITEQKMKWIFLSITENSFHWQKQMADEQGNWSIMADLFAKRKPIPDGTK